MIYQILYTRGTIKNNVSNNIYFRIKKTYSNSNVEEDEKQIRLKSRDRLENQHSNSGEKYKEPESGNIGKEEITAFEKDLRESFIRFRC